MSIDDRSPASPCLGELRIAYARGDAGGSWPRARSGSATEILASAELELLGVHHTELARILTRAVKWLERRTGGARLVAFQRRAAAAVAVARDSGAWVPSVAERVVHSQPPQWPSKILLARTAFELDPTAEHGELVERLRAAEGEA